MYGIGIAEQAPPTLEENVCNDNEGGGIYYWLNATGLARKNECSGNRAGIYVPETADPELVDNDCHDNTEADIVDERP